MQLQYTLYNFTDITCSYRTLYTISHRLHAVTVHIIQFHRHNMQLIKMISIWKGQCKKTKLRVLETVVFPTALYGCEAWTINNTDAKRITSFEMKCYRKILRISWMEKVTNKEVLSRLDMKTTMLLQKAKALKLKYFGHIKRHETLERHILEARIDGRRGRGRPTRRWEQDINDWMDMTTTQAGRLAEDRILFRQKVQEATSRQEISWSREREHAVTVHIIQFPTDYMQLQYTLYNFTQITCSYSTHYTISHILHAGTVHIIQFHSWDHMQLQYTLYSFTEITCSYSTHYRPTISQRLHAVTVHIIPFHRDYIL